MTNRSSYSFKSYYCRCLSTHAYNVLYKTILFCRCRAYNTMTIHIECMHVQSYNILSKRRAMLPDVDYISSNYNHIYTIDSMWFLCIYIHIMYIIFVFVSLEWLLFLLDAMPHDKFVMLMCSCIDTDWGKEYFQDCWRLSFVILRLGLIFVRYTNFLPSIKLRYACLYANRKFNIVCILEEVVFFIIRNVIMFWVTIFFTFNHWYSL